MNGPRHHRQQRKVLKIGSEAGYDYRAVVKAGALSTRRVKESELGSGSLLGRRRGDSASTSSRFSWRIGPRARLALLAAIVVVIATGAVLLTGSDTRSAAAGALAPAKGISATAVGIPSVAVVGTPPALEARRQPTSSHAKPAAPRTQATIATPSASQSTTTTTAATTPTPTPTVTAPVAPSVPTRSAAPRVSAPTSRPPSSGSSGSGTGAGGGTVAGGG
jgi:hypothetical protein